MVTLTAIEGTLDLLTQCGRVEVLQEIQTANDVVILPQSLSGGGPRPAAYALSEALTV
jgi:hypothetical protein